MFSVKDFTLPQPNLC